MAEDGNDYSHNAISDGDITRGEYRVALPDGRTQIVKYTADWKNGFNAEVIYINYSITDGVDPQTYRIIAIVSHSVLEILLILR